ncbi:MAG: FAD binding domain-containing protein [Saccharofermentanales bacterium]|jgi:CO/xanthine dehydrogenase FAD-binding subunit
MKYLIANSTAEVLEFLKEAGGTASILAGGTDLILDIESGKKNADTLVDVTRIPELKKIEEVDGFLEIGAAATLTEIQKNPLVRKYFPSLAKGCKTVGSSLIQNVATLAGNVITAQPAADAGMALSVLDPRFVLVDEEGTRECGVDEMYAGFGVSTLDSGRTLMTKIKIPLPNKNEAASFQRLELRKSLSLPMLNVAAMASIKDGKFEWVRLRMAPVGKGPVRAAEAEEWLVGKEVSIETIKKAGELALENANPRSNPLRGSKEYRESTLPVMVRRALLEIATQLKVMEG